MQPPARILFALVGDVRLSSRALRQLRWLAGAGFQVEALTFGPDEPEALGEGITLHRVERPPGDGPAFFWRAHQAFRDAAVEIAADVYHASDLYTLPALHAAAARHRGKLLFDARELYPFVDATAGKPWASYVWGMIEGRFAPRCDAVMTVNRSIAQRMAARYGIDEPVIVHNVPGRSTLATGGPSLRERLPIPADQPIVLYQGLLREGRGLHALIDAMMRVPDAALVIIGDGPVRDDVARLSAERLGSRAHLLPFTPPDDLVPLTASADLGICYLEPISESVRLALPNKLFEYLATGVPVVVSDLPEMTAVVQKFDVGTVVPSDQPERLAHAIAAALSDRSTRARWRTNIPRVFEAFDPERDRERFLDVYAGLTVGTKRR